MKKSILFGMMLFGFMATGFSQAEPMELLYASSDFSVHHRQDEISAIGTMMLKVDAWVISVKDSEGTTDYLPMSLDDRFKVEGLVVKFTGTLETIPGNVRMVGQPIRISKIEMIASEKN